MVGEINQYAGYASFIGMAAFFAINGFLKARADAEKKKKEKEEEEDRVDDRVIILLKEQVNALEKKLKAQEEGLKVTASRLDELVKENEILKKTLQGRDEATLEFQKQGFQTMKIIPQLFEMTRDTHSNINKLIGLMEHHLQIISQSIK